MLTSLTQIPNGAVKSYPLLPSEVGLIETGMALIGVLQNGKRYAARSTGNASDIPAFIGVAFYGLERPFTGVRPIIKEFTSGASATVYNGTHTVVGIGGITAANSVVVNSVNVSTGARTPMTLVTIAPANANEYRVTGTAPVQVTFHSTVTGLKEIIFTAVPTLADFGFGAAPYMPYSGGVVSSDIAMEVPVIGRGKVYTDKYAIANYAAGGTIRLLAGGYFAISGGQDIDTAPVFAKLLDVPTVDQGLGIELHQ